MFQSIATLVSILMISLRDKPTLTVLLTLLLQTVYLLSRLRHIYNVEACRTFFHARILSGINYVSNVWDSCSDVHTKKLLSVHKRAVKVLRAAPQMLPGRGYTSADPLLLKQHLQYNKCILVHKVVHNKSSTYLRQLLEHAINKLKKWHFCCT